MNTLLNNEQHKSGLGLLIFPVSDFLCPILGPDLLCLEITLSNYQILQTYASVSSLSPTVFLSKKLLQNIKQIILSSLSKEFAFSRLLTIEKSKSK